MDFPGKLTFASKKKSIFTDRPRNILFTGQECTVQVTIAFCILPKQSMNIDTWLKM